MICTPAERDLIVADPVLCRFVDFSTIPGCWIWTGDKTGHGYGRVHRSKAAGAPAGGRWVTHRYVYTLLVGPIPEGLVIDHLCRNRACCNPAHLQPCTNVENLAAPGSQAPYLLRDATHCKRGHEFTPENTAERSGRRACRQCIRERDRIRWERRRDAVNARRRSTCPS